jgi:putative CocE/NonD family hydrolase
MIADAFVNRGPVLDHLPLKQNPYFKFPGMWDIFNAMVLSFNPDFEDPLLRPILTSAMQRFGIPTLEEAVFWPYRMVKVPALHVAGWYDISTWSTFANFTGMRDKGGSEFARQNQHILMGPWQHGAQNAEHLGDLDFGGYSPSGPTMHADVIAFFDKYLKGKDTEVPTIKYFTMGENRWHTADEWPLPGTERQRFYLHSGGHANTSAGDGVLSSKIPNEEPTDSFVYDPRNPFPTTGGRHIEMGGVVPGPKNQIYVEQRNDVLCYTTSELTEGVEVTGWVKLHLYAATSAKDTDFTAQLIDVHPDGRAYNMADGVIRARYRKSIFSPELVTPGEVDEYTISLGVTSHLFKKGHRIRVDISSSNFPAWDRNMNTGNRIGEDAEPIKATQTIYHSAEYPSYFELPVIPR